MAERSIAPDCKSGGHRPTGVRIPLGALETLSHIPRGMWLFVLQTRRIRKTELVYKMHQVQACQRVGVA